MRLITGLLTLPIFIAVVIFILQNRMQVTISFWPLDAEATMPVSVLSLGLLIVGFVMGSVMTGAAVFRSSWQARRLRGEVAKLQAQLKEKDNAPLPCEPTILYKGRYQTVSTLEKQAPRSWWSRLWRKG